MSYLYISPLSDEQVLTLTTNNLVTTDTANELVAWALTQDKASTTPFSMRLDEWYADLSDRDKALVHEPTKGTIATFYLPMCDDISTAPIQRVTYLVP